MKLEDESVRNLLRRAIRLWGEQDQWRQLVEELCELSAMINRYRRKRVSVEQVAGEVADALIMFEQARLMTGNGFDHCIEEKTSELGLDDVISDATWAATSVSSRATQTPILRYEPLGEALSSIRAFRLQIGPELVDNYISKKLKRLQKRVEEAEA